MQNADWATHFLLRKFNITASDDLVGTDFGQFVKQKHSRRQGGKPFLSGKTWKTTHDPWRGISRASFGIDYLKHYKVAANALQPHVDTDGKFMQLNCFGDENNVTDCWEVYTQRLVLRSAILSVYPANFLELLYPTQRNCNGSSQLPRYRKPIRGAE